MLLSLSLMMKSKHNGHTQMCKMWVWLYCRIRSVSDDELCSSFACACESQAGTAVGQRKNSCVLLCHLMDWILLTASLTPGDFFCIKSWCFPLGLCNDTTVVFDLQPLQIIQWEGGVSYLPGRFPSSLCNSDWGGLGWISWGCLHLPTWSVRSVTHLHLHRAAPWEKRHHQSCRAIERKPTKFLLSLSTACGKSSLFCKRIWWGFCVFCPYVLFSAWLLRIHGVKQNSAFLGKK